MLTLLICLLHLLYMPGVSGVEGQTGPHTCPSNLEDATIMLPWYTSGFL